MISSTPLSSPADAPVGVFDSGVGGLSVLRHIQAQLPQEHLLYFADSGYAPYGDKPEHVVAQRSLIVANFLVEHGAKALVVACNTATVAAINALRAHYPALPIVGVEPGLKPAAALTRSGTVGVLATDMTLSGARFLQLRETISQATQAKFLLQPCIGLVDLIERGELDSPATLALLERYVAPLVEQGADTLVLGCTHYPFVRDAIAAIAVRYSGRTVNLIDTGDAVARQLARLLGGAGLLRTACRTTVLQGMTSGSEAALAAAFSRLLGLAPEVTHMALPTPLDCPINKIN